MSGIKQIIKVTLLFTIIYMDVFWGGAIVKAQPHLLSNAFILMDANDNAVLLERNSNIKYSSSLALKVGLSIGIIHGLSQGNDDRLNSISQLLIDDFADEEGLGIPDIIGMLFSYGDSSLDNRAFEEEIIYLLNQAYDQAGSSIYLRGPWEIRDGTVLVSLNDMVQCISHLVQLQNSVLPALARLNQYDTIKELSMVSQGTTIDSPWYFQLENHYMIALTHNNLTLIAAVYESPDLEEDANSLLEYGFYHYERHALAKKNSIVEYVKVEGGIGSVIGLIITEDIYVITEVDAINEVEMRIQIQQPLEPPIKKHEKVGYISVYKNNNMISRVDLIADREIMVKDTPAKIWEWFLYLVKYFG